MHVWHILTPQHDNRWGALRVSRQTGHSQELGGDATNWQSYPPNGRGEQVSDSSIKSLETGEEEIGKKNALAAVQQQKGEVKDDSWATPTL